MHLQLQRARFVLQHAQGYSANSHQEADGQLALLDSNRVSIIQDFENDQGAHLRQADSNKHVDESEIYGQSTTFCDSSRCHQLLFGQVAPDKDSCYSKNAQSQVDLYAKDEEAAAFSHLFNLLNIYSIEVDDLIE